MPFYIRVPSLITPVHCITQTEEPFFSYNQVIVGFHVKIRPWQKRPHPHEREFLGRSYGHRLFYHECPGGKSNPAVASRNLLAKKLGRSFLSRGERMVGAKRISGSRERKPSSPFYPGVLCLNFYSLASLNWGATKTMGE